MLYQKLEAPSWRPQTTIILGNIDAENIITVAAKPFCGPCAQMHKRIENLLNRYRNLKVEYIFMSCDGPTDMNTIFLNYLVSIDKTESRNLALKDFYENGIKNFDAWTNKWINHPVEAPSKKLQEHCEWCNEAGIEKTPTIFVNGYELPVEYELEQIRWFLNKRNNLHTSTN